MNIVLKIVAIAFIASCFAVVGSRLFDANWSSKPSRQELETAQKRIWMPPDSKVLSTDWISKITFSGYSVSMRSTSNLDVVLKRYEQSAVDQKWLLKQSRNRGGHYRRIYCMGIVAQDIEIESVTSNGGAIITAGSYWAADRGDSRYCRKPA